MEHFFGATLRRSMKKNQNSVYLFSLDSIGNYKSELALLNNEILLLSYLENDLIMESTLHLKMTFRSKVLVEGKGIMINIGNTIFM